MSIQKLVKPHFSLETSHFETQYRKPAKGTIDSFILFIIFVVGILGTFYVLTWSVDPTIPFTFSETAAKLIR